MLNMKKLLIKILDLLTVEQWNDIDLNNVVTSRGDNKYRRIGNFVEVEVNFSTSAAHSSYTSIVATNLPEAYRPSQPVKIPTQPNSTVICVTEVRADGSIQIYNNTTTGAYFAGRIVYCPKS